VRNVLLPEDGHVYFKIPDNWLNLTPKKTPTGISQTNNKINTKITQHISAQNQTKQQATKAITNE
jgi:hypothetical protein